jgi:hypothetical protein
MRESERVGAGASAIELPGSVARRAGVDGEPEVVMKVAPSVSLLFLAALLALRRRCCARWVRRDPYNPMQDAAQPSGAGELKRVGRAVPEGLWRCSCSRSRRRPTRRR